MTMLYDYEHEYELEGAVCGTRSTRTPKRLKLPATQPFWTFYKTLATSRNTHTHDHDEHYFCADVTSSDLTAFLRLLGCLQSLVPYARPASTSVVHSDAMAKGSDAGHRSR